MQRMLTGSATKRDGERRKKKKEADGVAAKGWNRPLRTRRQPALVAPVSTFVPLGRFATGLGRWK